MYVLTLLSLITLLYTCKDVASSSKDAALKKKEKVHMKKKLQGYGDKNKTKMVMKMCTG